MAEYIEREAVFELLRDEDFCVTSILAIPAADVQPVVHGKWIDHMVRDWRCSECGEKIHKVRKVDGYCYNDKPNYCPNCGCRMDAEE